MAGFADFVEETAWREGTDTFLVVVTVVAAAWLRFRTRLPTEGFKDEEAVDASAFNLLEAGGAAAGGFADVRRPSVLPASCGVLEDCCISLSAKSFSTVRLPSKGRMLALGK